jgi:methylated-DNA-[protein]-cysteine S-methyltransferase
MYYTRFDARFCEIILVGDESGVTDLHLNTGEGKRVFEVDPNWTRSDGFFKEIKRQLLDYFDGIRQTFDVKLNPQGTEYQKNVWQHLQQIPFGELRTYKDIAGSLGNDKASRAVGMANSKNPIPLIIPCHRVVGTNGKLTGFAHGLAIKEKLINFEQSNSARA